MQEAIAYLRAGSEIGFGALADPEGWSARLTVPGAVLMPAELLDVVSLAEVAGGAKQTFKSEAAKYPLLAERAASLGDFRLLSQAIRRAVMPNGEISDDASPQLKRIRANVLQAREKIKRSLEGILRGRGEPSGEDYITLRNDRFVIPVRASDRRGVPGVVHGASGTGQTVFVEPLETIDLNNRLVQLGEDETAEIARILEELTERVRVERAPLEAAASEIAHLDSIFARARFARKFDCVAPRFSSGNSLRLEAARNPVLEATLRPQGRKAVPLSLALGGDETVMVVSGPNTGGKTVSLKTVGLAALSAQSGIPVAADAAELPIFDKVLVDIGDEQSIAADLSTFSAHMLNLKSMLEGATERSLILVDEMGTGTAPEEGAALAVALLEEFRGLRALTFATTHHDRLKAYASTTAGIVNAAMEFDEENLRPDVQAARRRAGHLQWDRNRAPAGAARASGRACARQSFARIAGGARSDRLSASQPGRNRASEESNARGTRATSGGAPRAANGMGGAAEKAHRRTGKELSRNGKTSGERNRAGDTGCERPCVEGAA